MVKHKIMAEIEEVTQNQPSSQCQIVPEDCVPGPEHHEVRRMVRAMKSDLSGIVHLGSDGVFRSLTADREVIGAVPLPPRLIKAMLETMPMDHNPEMEDRMRGVDGTRVPQEQLYHPDPADLPPPLSKEQKEEADRFYEENKEVIEANVKKMKEDPEGGCPLRVWARYDLEPR